MTTLHAGLPVGDHQSERFVLDLKTTLPVPPSANNLYVNGRGGRRFKSKGYKAWLRECAVYLRHLDYRRHFDKPGGKKDKTKCVIILDVPINYKRDLDNVIKPTQDALRRSAVIPDDRYVDEVHAYRARPPYDDGGDRMTVCVLKEVSDGVAGGNSGKSEEGIR